MMRVKTISLLSLSMFLSASLVWAKDAKDVVVKNEVQKIITKEVAPTAGRIGPVAHNPGIDSQWDMWFWFDSQTPVADGYQLGVEYANGHFYVTAASNYAGTSL